MRTLTKYLTKLQTEAARGQSKAVRNLVSDSRFKEALLKAERLEEANVEHPKLRALQKVVLRELYNAREKKIIIFNQYRDQAVRIKEAMEAIRVPAEIFVGQMKKGETGMSQKEQQRIINEFRKGAFNCLIATSVAEEGLDIPRVDVVIFYEPVPSAIRTVQRRGRTGRHGKGKMILLVTNGTRDVGYKYAAKNKERRMYRVMNEVKRSFATTTKQARETTLAEYDPRGGVIIADHREKAGRVLRVLAERGATIKLEQLPTGDYALSDRVIVEYKSVPDFVESIIDGRLLSQLRALRAHPRPLLIIEGEENLFSIRKIHPNAILGMIATIAIQYNIPLLFTKNPQETASLLQLIARKEAEAGRHDHQPRAQKPLAKRELQEYVVASLPGVGGALAKQLLNHFKSVRAIANASEEKLAMVEKVGEKKARQIHDLFTSRYDEDE